MTNTSTEQGTGAPGGAGGGQGQEPTAGGQQGTGAPGGQQQGNGTGDGGTGSGDQFDLSTITDPAARAFVEAQQRAAREAREQAARYRTERNEARTQATQYQQANETAEQRAQREQQEREQAAQTDRQERERLERELADLRIGTRVSAAATTAKAHNPELVVQMLTGKVTLDEQGNPTNLQALLDDLKRTDAYLFKRTTTVDAGAGRGGGDGSALPDNHPNRMLRRAMGKE